MAECREDKWVCQWDAQIVSFVTFPSCMAFDRWHTAFYANNFTLASLYVCVWEDVWKNGGFFWHFKLQLGQFHPADCVGWGLRLFQPALHEMPSPAAGSSCHSAAPFLSLTSLPAPVSLGLLAGERARLCSFLLGFGGAIWDPQRMFLIFCPFLFYLNPRTSGSHHV